MKRIMMIPLACLFAVTVNAQLADGPSWKAFSFGPIMGFGHSWTTPTKFSEYNPAMSAGVFGIYSPHEHWGVGMDARYSIEGSKKDYPEGGVVNQDYHYLRVPIRAMYFFGDYEDDFRPKITLGPSMGFLLRSKGPAYIHENNLDIGVVGTAGFNYRIVRGTWLNWDVGCYHGFSDAALHNSTKDGQRNIMMNLGIGFEI